MEYFLLLVLFILWWIFRSRDRRERNRQFHELSNRLEGLERRLNENTAAPAKGDVATSFQDLSSTQPPPAPATSDRDQRLAHSGITTSAANTSSEPEDQPSTRSAIPTPVFPSLLDTATDGDELEGQPSAARAISLEERLGANWLNKLGIVILVFGVAFFLAYQLRTLGPLGKILVSYAVSSTLLIGGLFLERKKQYRIFARAGIGGGWALTFFTTYAMYHLPATQLISSQLFDLTLMLVVAVGMVWHSLRYSSQVVTGLAFLLAFSTVALSQVSVFSLVVSALLAAGLVVVTSRKHWFELELAGLIGVYFNHLFWLHRVMSTTAGHDFPEYFSSAGLIVLYWLIFRIAYLRGAPQNRHQEILSSFGAILNSAAVLGLLKYQSYHSKWAFWVLLALAIAEMLLALYARPRRRVAFIVLSSIASSLFLAAIPLRFNGSNWSMLWLLEAEVLFIAGLRMRESIFRRLGIIAGAAAALQLAFADVLPIFLLRQASVDGDRHFALALALAGAAVLYWFNSQIAPLRSKEAIEEAIDAFALRATSYLGLLSAAGCLWLLLPSSQTAVAWMALALFLGFAADKLNSRDLAAQVDILSAASLLRLLDINLSIADHWGFFTQRAITATAAAGLFYACTRRKTSAAGLRAGYVPATYSWAGSALLALLIWYELLPVSIAVGWGILGLLLFEIGNSGKRPYLRHQGYLLLAASFVRLLFVNLREEGPGHLLGSRIYTVLPLILAYFWIHERLESNDGALLDRITGILASWLGTIALVALAFVQVSADWIVTAWTLIVLTLVVSAWILHRQVFLEQALALTVAAAARAILFNLYSDSPLQASSANARLLSVGIAAAILFLTLPIAFRLRKRDEVSDRSSGLGAWLKLAITRPEQTLFFAPLLVVTILLAHEMRAGMITVAWSALGVAVFLLALRIGERTYRLAGLGLLLLGVGKILVIDVWKLAPTDRYTTLIVMGIALLLVSFLYTRYREAILKFL